MQTDDTPSNLPRKKKLIKDTLWGSIVLLPWEELIIENPVFARLHGILQNSTAYRVYPSLRVSRFAHSVGVMHVSAELFQACVWNSSKGVQPVQSSSQSESHCLMAEAAELSSHLDSSDHRTEIIFETKRHFHLVLSDGHPPDDSLYILLAALRIAALLHDLGHLPYSHVFEFAVEDASSSALRGEIPDTPRHQKPAKDKGGKQSEEQLIVEKWRAETTTSLTHLKNNKQGKFHEILGRELMHTLEQLFAHQAEQPYAGCASELIKAALRILASELPITKTFVDGIIDADRIDFVRRDTHFSGLLTSSVDFPRLFKLFELHPRSSSRKEVASSSPPFAAMPGMRSISDAEKLLWERFQDYKYIACHHRVHLHDELLERCIVQLILAGKLDEFLKTLDHHLNHKKKGGAVGALEGMRNRFHDTVALLTKCDDAWLDIQLRELYITLQEDKPQSLRNLNERGLQYARNVVNGYVIGIESHVSAFTKDHDFWEYAKNLSPILSELAASKGQARQDGVTGIARRVNEVKRTLEQLILRDHDIFVIIGDVSHKLKIGFGLNHLASYSSLNSLVSLHEFLTEKAGETAPFNFWLPREQFNAKNKELVFTKITTSIDPQKYLQFA